MWVYFLESPVEIYKDAVFSYLRDMLPQSISQKRILLSPLNWGMGHVARCIPLIDTFLKNGNTVIVAVSDDQAIVFRAYFPSIEVVKHEGYPFVFAGKGNFSLDLARQFKGLKKRLRSEVEQTEKLVNDLHIDLVISDHRYGFYSTQVPSIMITHQLNLPVRWFEGWVQKVHERYLRQFTEIWIPDMADSSFAGQLSENLKNFNCTYIGALSRFQLNAIPAIKTIDSVIIASGPSIYAEQFVREQLKKLDANSKAIIIASPEVKQRLGVIEVAIQSAEDWKSCDETIIKARKIISRCGYSTLMDLSVLKVPFSLTPTPGQREQEYLYQYWASKVIGE
jgi:UDP:flavonoid glycosyltransferase YjiC (YdhE family)